MSEFWTATLSSLIGSLLGSGISIAAIWWQTRSTNIATLRQAHVLTSAEDKRHELAEARAAAQRYHDIITDVIEALAEMHEAANASHRDTGLAAFEATRAAAERTVGRFIFRHPLILPSLPEPQRDWLAYMTDRLSSFFPCSPVVDEAALAALGRELRKELDWLYWAQDVLVTVMRGTSECPPEPARARASAIA